MAVSHIKSVTIADFTGTVTVFNSNGATQTANATDIVRPSDWNSIHNLYHTLSGNTAGTSTVSGSNIVFQGGNNLTLSASTAAGAATIIFSGPNTVAQSTQPGVGLGVSNTGNTLGNTGTASSGTIVFGASGGITASQSTAAGSNSTIWFSVANPVAQTNQSAIRGLGVSNTGTTLGNTGVSTGIDWVIAGSGNITASQSTVGGGPNTIWLSVPAGGGGGVAAGVSNTGTTAGNTGTVSSGTLVFAASGNITASQSTGAGQSTIWLSVPAQSAVAGHSIGVSNTGTTLGNTGTGSSGSIIFAASGNITASQSTAAGASTIWFSVPAQSAVAGHSVGVSNTGNTLGNTGTGSSGSVVFAASGNITASQSTAAGASTIWFSVPAQSAQTGNLYVSANSTQLSSTAGVDLRTLSFAGAGIASVGVSNGVVLVSVPAGGGGGDGYNIIAVNGGATNLSTTLTLSNSNNVTFGIAAGVITASASFAGGGGGVAIADSAATISNSTVVFSNANGVSFGLAGSTMTASVNAGGGAAFTGGWWQPEVYGNNFTTTFANGTVYLRPFEIDGYYDADYGLLMMSGSSSASTASFSGSISNSWSSSGTGSWGLSGTALVFSRVNTNETNASYNSIVTMQSNTYSISAGYSVSQAVTSNVSSQTVSITTSWGVGFLSNIGSDGGVTTGSTGTSGSTSFSSSSTAGSTYSSSFALSGPYQHLSGWRPLRYPMGGTNMTPGEYWMGHIQSTTSGSTNMSLQRVAMLASAHMQVYSQSNTQNSYLEIGSSANLSTSNFRLGFGSYSASSNTTTNIALTQVTQLSSNASLWFAVAGKTQ